MYFRACAIMHQYIVGSPNCCVFCGLSFRWMKLVNPSSSDIYEKHILYCMLISGLGRNNRIGATLIHMAM